MLTEAAGERKFLRNVRYVHRLFGWAFVLFIIVLAGNAYAFTIFHVDGHSMESTLHNGQLLPVTPIGGYAWWKPKLKDIVIVQYEGTQKVRFVKRIVGVPGDMIPFNGQTIQLQSDEYFVAGDNRDFSTDSRTYGPIKRSQLIGLVLGNHGTGPAFP